MMINIPKLKPDSKEFIILMAISMSVLAISIDALLPALPHIANEYGIVDANLQQFVITCFFGGLAIGQLFCGSLSDNIGRKPTVYIGVALFMIGCLIILFATSFTMVLAGRFIQGLGAAGPRIMSVAIVRDCFKGADMARITSYVLGIFILMPTIAPTIGQIIINLSNWHMIVIFFLAHAIILSLWLNVRLPETLHDEYRREFSFASFFSGVKEVMKNRQFMTYTIQSGLIFGAFIGFLNSSPQIFGDYFNDADNFSYYFGAMALSMGGAYFTNGAIVRKFGIHTIIRSGLIGLMALSAIFIAGWAAYDAPIPLLIFMPYLMFSAYCFGLLFGNMGALSMEPMGHMAGIASSFSGFFSLVISATVGGIIGQLFDNSLLPLAIGFGSLAFISFLLMQWTETRHIKEKI